MPGLLLWMTAVAMVTGSGGPQDPEAAPIPVPGVLTPCVGGMAGIYPCSNIDLQAFVPLADMGCTAGNSLWGWTDPLNGREYALMGCSNGISFVDITTPASPVFLGRLPTQTATSSWRDVRVHANHAFVVSEASSHGMQVFNLTRLRGLTAPPPGGTFAPDAHYAGPPANPLTSTHTIAINEATGYAYLAGTASAANCGRGLYIVNIQNPTSPTFAGCVSSDGYTHETQCAIYQGPDAQYQGREICFSSNVDTLTIVDVTNKANPVQISRTGYTGSGYTHQAWLTEDHAYLLMDDELDEQQLGHNTRTRIWNMADLDAPPPPLSYDGPTTAIDHNLYVKGGFAFEANYRAGLRILSLSGIATGTLTEAAHFDIYPANDSPSFNGAWNNYPFFTSGNVIVSGIEQGLFVLRPTMLAFLAVGDLTTLEGNSGTTDATFTVTLTPASAQTVTVNYATAPGTANAGADYQHRSGTLTFAPDETSKTVTVPVVGDTLDEANETFFLNLSSPSNAGLGDGQGRATITDDDGPPAMSIADVTVTEGNSGTVNATFTVSISNASGQLVSVYYTTANGTAQEGIAPPGDYRGQAYQLWIVPGSTTATITILVNGDYFDEGDETFFVQLAGAINAVLVDNSAVGMIVDDDTLSVSSMSPDSGPAAGGTTVTLTGSSFVPGTEVHVGPEMGSNVEVLSDSQIRFQTPALAPGTLNETHVEAAGILPQELPALHPSHGLFWLSDFTDVPQSYLLHDDVELIFRNGITSGCAAGYFCPSNSVLRSQMAVFLLRSKDGAAYVPPACTAGLERFTDVPASDPFCRWIEELARRGITGGCTATEYCPSSPITRTQMAVFLLRTKEGSGYAPPACVSPLFDDVPCTYPFAAWINELARRGITGGCDADSYCPGDPTTRGQMARFLVRTFGLAVP